MSIVPISPKLELSFTPPGATGDPPPVYRYRPPTELQRHAWRARVASQAGVQAGPAQVRTVVANGLARLCEDPADREALLALWDAAQEADRAAGDIAQRAAPVAAERAALPEDGDPSALDAALAALQEEAQAAAMSEAQQDQLERLDDMLRRYHPPYARLIERRALWAALSPRAACQMFLTGWRDVVDGSGAGVPFKRLSGEVPDELLDRLPAGHVAIVGAQILTSMFPTRDDAKKPDSPSGSPGGPTSSSTTAESPSSAQAAGTGATDRAMAG